MMLRPVVALVVLLLGDDDDDDADGFITTTEAVNGNKVLSPLVWTEQKEDPP